MRTRAVPQGSLRCRLREVLGEQLARLGNGRRVRQRHVEDRGVDPGTEERLDRAYDVVGLAHRELLVELVAGEGRQEVAADREYLLPGYPQFNLMRLDFTLFYPF